LTNSGGWVSSGWIGFSQWFKKEFGIYPPRKMLVELRKMSKEEREEHPWFGVYLWGEKKDWPQKIRITHAGGLCF